MVYEIWKVKLNSIRIKSTTTNITSVSKSSSHFTKYYNVIKNDERLEKHVVLLNDKNINQSDIFLDNMLKQK